MAGRWVQDGCSEEGEIAKEGNPHLGLKGLVVVLGHGRLGKGC